MRPTTCDNKDIEKGHQFHYLMLVSDDANVSQKRENIYYKKNDQLSRMISNRFLVITWRKQ